jgi:two-component system, OmpR family, sensor histidine kinase TctE
LAILQAPSAPGAISLRRYLLWGILLPVLLFVVVDTVILYRQSLAAVNLAYDRTLLASAKTIGEQLDVQGEGALLRVVPRVPYAALEAFEADNRSRMFYRVTGFDGEMVSGFEKLKPWRGRIPDQPPYAALVDFYDDTITEEAREESQSVPSQLPVPVAVRVAVLLQPVAGLQGNGMAVVQVAETLELRETLARDILISTLWRQALLVLVIAGVVVWVVQRAVSPVRELSAQITARPENDLSPLHAARTPRELQPLVQANNQLMQRLDHLLQHQKRFVRDTAHQLRTPLAVLKVQTQSALRGDAPPAQALQEINTTVDRAIALANQMLSLAKVEQLRQQADAPVTDWSAVLRELALEMAPLLADKDLDFSIDTQAANVRAHDWMLRELTRNLLHNAIKHTPEGGVLSVRVVTDNTTAELVVADHGAGIDAELRTRLFQPFSAGRVQAGSGLGLAICAEIASALHGVITLDNRMVRGQVEGLDARVRLPIV